VLWQHVIKGILAFFIAIMIYVAWVAYSRPSGFAGMNMSDVQQARHEFNILHSDAKVKSK